MNALDEDIRYALDSTEPLWAELRNGRILLTGGTGFLGCWLLESFLWANREFGLKAEVVVLTRNCAAFRSKAPHLAGDATVRLHQGDARNFSLPDGEITHVIHAAGETSVASLAEATGLLERSFDGMRNILNQAHRHRVKKMLFASSGAVYGPRETGRQPIAEEDTNIPIQLGPKGVYAESKRLAEILGAVFAEQHGFEFKIARGFAFLGPYLPLTSHFAAANFIADALAGASIKVQGNGTGIRSYLYAADMAAWLWTILLRGESGRPYNVGSDKPIRIAELARTIANACTPVPEVQVLGLDSPGIAADYYVPDVSRARNELGLKESRSLHEAIERTLAWHQNCVN
jgi:nucleoside-diphosphate-sugar epimerase